MVESTETYKQFHSAQAEADALSVSETYDVSLERLRAAAAAATVIKPAPTTNDVRTRAVAAIIGAATADAASMPLHWVYNLEKLAELTEASSFDVLRVVFCP